MKGQKRTLKRGIFIICFYDKLIIRDRIKLRNVGKEVFNGAVAVKYTRKCEIFVKLNVKKNNLRNRIKSRNSNGLSILQVRGQCCRMYVLIV